MKKFYMQHLRRLFWFLLTILTKLSLTSIPLTSVGSQESHCVKSVRIRSYSGLYFPAIGLNTERYSVPLRIQSKCGKTRTRITPNTDIFYALSVAPIGNSKSKEVPLSNKGFTSKCSFY